MMNTTMKEGIFATVTTLSVILIYSEQVGLTNYLSGVFHYLIPMVINPVNLLAIPILRNNGIIWGSLVLLISMFAIFWEATLFFSLIVTAVLTWIITGIILLLKKIFKDNHIEYFLKINVIYGFLAFISVGFLSIFVTVLSEKDSVWMNENLLLLTKILAVSLIPVFWFYSKATYRNITHYLTMNKPSLSKDSVIMTNDSTDNEVIKRSK